MPSVDSSPTNLPAQLTTFVGRRPELTTIKNLLTETRLLTLTSSGGCGKSRLALQAAAGELEDHADGVWWVDLGPLAQPELLANTVAITLGLQEVPLQSFGDSLIAGLRGKSLLLILDNCEHLVDACAKLVDKLLRNCPLIKVVATSREPLGIDGETIWRVPSMSLPQDSAIAVDALPKFDALSLFTERAMKARPNFRITDESLVSVVEICRRLDGIPLAIELAAARTRLLSPEQIAQGLIDRFHLLAGGARTAVPRQQTLLASVEWSYKLLNEVEKALLRRLAVFAGGFSLDAAENVCSDESIEPSEILDLLGSLVDKSLVQADAKGREARYRVLETIRQYANQKLVDTEEAAVVRDRHLDFYAGLAEEARAAFEGGPDEASWFERLDLEQDNQRAALEWAHTTNPEKGMQIARALWMYWYARGDWSEGSMRCEVAAAASDASPHWRARALAAGAGLATNGLELGRARTLGGQAVALARSIHDDRALLEAVYAEASAYFFTDPRRGRTLAHEASELASKSGDRFWIARTLYGLGICDCNAGNSRSGRRLLEEAVDLFTDSNSRLALYLAFFWLGQTSVAQGDLEDARRWAGEGLAAAREFRNVQIEAANYCTIAHANALAGDRALAITALESARALSAKHPDPITASILPYYDDVLTYAFGEPTATTRSWRDALAFFEAGGFWWFAASILSIRADIVRVRGDLMEAEALAERAVHTAGESGNPYSIGCGARARANVLRAKGDIDTCEDLYHLALRSFDEAGAKADVVFTLESLAGIAVHGERWQEAARLFGAANHLRETLGYERFAADIPDYEGDLGRVRENLDVQALELGWREGAALTMDEAVAYAGRGRGERKRPASGWKSLTPMETEVVRLVTTGLSNAEIGKRLFISPGTVKNHLSHVFGKLDISTRAELAAEAARRKL